MFKPLAVLAAAVSLAACGDAPTQTADEQYGREGGRFTIELAAGDGQAVHYIHGGTYGRAATLVTQEHDRDAARLIRGREAERAYRAAAADLDLATPDPEDLKIKVFGFELYADPDEGENGQVRINAGIPGGRNFALNAAGENDEGAALLTFTGWSRRETARYIDGIENAPREVRDQMKDQLGL